MEIFGIVLVLIGVGLGIYAFTSARGGKGAVGAGCGLLWFFGFLTPAVLFIIAGCIVIAIAHRKEKTSGEEISSEIVLEEPATLPGPSDSANEIRKFKQLADEGIITQEEFEAKKRQILDLGGES